MILKKVFLELSVHDVQEMLAIDLDGDPEKALAFYPGKSGQAGEKGSETSLSAGFRGQLRPDSEGSLLMIK